MDSPLLLLCLDLLLQEDGILEELLRVAQRGVGRPHPLHGVQSILGVVVGPAKLLTKAADVLPAVNGRGQRLANVLGKAVEGQRGLVGADVLRKGERQ